MENETKIQKTEATAIQRPDAPHHDSLLERGAALIAQSGGNMTPDHLEKLLDVHLRNEANEARKAFVVAMAEFKMDPPKIIKDKDNKQYSSKYASLANVTENINTKLSEHGLSASWKTGQKDNNWPEVTCTITHIQGHSESTSLAAPPDESGKKNPIQQIVSTVSYLERCTLLSLTGLATYDQDDDGNAAGKKPTGIRQPTDDELKVIDAVCNAMTCPEGKRADARKVAAICYENKQAYPYDMTFVPTIAKWLSEMDRPELFVPENRSDFEIGQDMPGDEDSTPDTEVEATAQSKFGEEVIECRYLCNGCSEEFEEFKLQGVCPNPTCLGRDIIDRRAGE